MALQMSTIDEKAFNSELGVAGSELLKTALKQQVGRRVYDKQRKEGWAVPLCHSAKVALGPICWVWGVLGSMDHPRHFFLPQVEQAEQIMPYFLKNVTSSSSL
jgi:hypothetical protein